MKSVSIDRLIVRVRWGWWVFALRRHSLLISTGWPIDRFWVWQW
jgi:hypothetical protein